MDIDIDPCCCISKDPDMAHSSSLDWDFTMAPGGRVGHSQQAIPLHPQSPDLPLFKMLKLFHFSLSSAHHTLAHYGGSCYRLATWLASPWVTTSSKWMSMAFL